MATSESALDAQRSRSGLARLLVAHPVASYFVLAIAGTWLCLLPILVSADALNLVPFTPSFPLFVALFVLSSYAGPTLGAVIVTRALEGGPGLRRFFRRYVQWRVGVLPFLLVFFGFPLVWLAAMTVQLGGGVWQALAAQPLTFFTTYLPAVLIFPALITWGEEPGWRGFALTRLQERYTPLVAALTVGFVHGVWHLPNFLMTSGPTAAGPFDPLKFGGNILVIMVISIIFSWVFNLGKQSILIAVLLHASFNATGAWLNGLVKIPLATEYVLYGLYLAIALVLVIATRGRLGYRGTARTAGSLPAQDSALAGVEAGEG